jgi:hypothetical protein
LEVSPHLQLIGFELSSLDSAWQVDGGKHEDGVETPVRVDFPALCCDFRNPANDKISYLRAVSANT